MLIVVWGQLNQSKTSMSRMMGDWIKICARVSAHWAIRVDQQTRDFFNAGKQCQQLANGQCLLLHMSSVYRQWTTNGHWMHASLNISAPFEIATIISLALFKSNNSSAEPSLSCETKMLNSWHYSEWRRWNKTKQKASPSKSGW